MIEVFKGVRTRELIKHYFILYKIAMFHHILRTPRSPSTWFCISFEMHKAWFGDLDLMYVHLSHTDTVFALVSRNGTFV